MERSVFGSVAAYLARNQTGGRGVTPSRRTPASILTPLVEACV